MNIKKLAAIGIVSVAVSALALDYCEVTGVNARQRYPWNGLVDIDFTLDSKATEPYLMNVTVFDNVGKTNLPVKTVYTEGISFEENPCMVHKDTTRIIWNAAADLPNGFKCTNVLVTCQDTRAGAVSNLYMIVDLAGGATAESFPISFTNKIPAGGWTEEHMTTKLVLRRVEPSSFMMGSFWTADGHQSNETQHKVTLTKPYYIAIYELTAKQFALIYGGTGTDTTPTTQRMSIIRGNEMNSGYSATVSSTTLAGGDSSGYPFYTLSIVQDNAEKYSWPSTSEVDPSSLMGKLRAKTGLMFDLPTEAQWERACRAGSALPLNIGTPNTSANASLMNGPAKLDPTETHYLYVGNYMPNALGLYDMSGGVDEWCLDAYRADLGSADVIDPNGGNRAITESSSTLLAETPIKNYDAAVSLTFNGKTWGTFPKGEDHTNWFKSGRLKVMLKSYSSARVVRGANVRSAARVQDAIFQRDSAPVKAGSKTLCNPSASDSAKHGIRVALTVDE